MFANIGCNIYLFARVGPCGLSIYRDYFMYLKRHWDSIKGDYVKPHLIEVYNVIIASNSTYKSSNDYPEGFRPRISKWPASWETGSGGGCSAFVIRVTLLNKLRNEDLQRILNFL